MDLHNKFSNIVPTTKTLTSDSFLDDIDYFESLTEIHFHFLPNMFTNPSTLNYNSNVNDNSDNNNASSTCFGVVNLSSYDLSNSELSL